MTFYTKETIGAKYIQMLQKIQPTDVCWSWVVAKRDIGFMNYHELEEQVSIWKTCGKNLKCFDYNNRTITQGQHTWYSMCLQECDENGKFLEDSDENPDDPFGMLMFGYWVNGYNFYFKSEDIRDAVVKAVNNKKEIEFDFQFVGKKGLPINKCVLCSKHFEGYGNNAYPLSADGDECCDKCNPQVIQARMKGVFRCEHADPDEILAECKGEMVRRLKEYTDEVMLENGKRFQDCVIPNVEPYRECYELKECLCRNITLLVQQLVQQSIQYVKGRIQRHLTIRTISSINDLVWTAMPEIKGYLRDHIEEETILLWNEIQQRYNDIVDREEELLKQKQEEEQKKKEEELKAIWKEEQAVAQELRRTQKADTREANKSRDAKKKEREEFERRQAECMRLKAQAEAKKRQQKAQKKAQAQKLK